MRRKNWGKWGSDDNYWEPGLTFSLELVRWFAELQIPCFLTNTLANETTYEPRSGLMLALHAALMRNLGVVFTEMTWLDELAADCAEDGHTAVSTRLLPCR
jgi:kynurenine formamidase